MKILMVCLGNICRSPLAEGIMRKKINERNLNANVESVGTSNYHVGEGADPRSEQVGKKNGVDLSNHRGRQFVTSDFDRYDRIFVMDRSNYRNVMNLARKESDRSKVDLIMNVVTPGSNNEVPDPYYSGSNGFELVYNMLDEACGMIADEIEESEIG
jgi:protein-tyrosine phosphatase